LRSLYWEIPDKVDAHYNFGLLSLDSTPFRSYLKTHVLQLIEALENHIEKDINAKITKLQGQVQQIESKFQEEVSNLEVDDVIAQLE